MTEWETCKKCPFCNRICGVESKFTVIQSITNYCSSLRAEAEAKLAAMDSFDRAVIERLSVKLAAAEAEIKRLKAILKPLVAPTFKLDVPIEEAIKKGIPSREDDGRDPGE